MNKGPTKKRKSGGFTLMEAVVAIGLVFVGLVGVLILLTQSAKSIRTAENRLVAAHLAQEAAEVVIAIRDSNWAASQDWRTNLPATIQGIVDYSSTAVIATGNPANYCLSTVNNVYQHVTPPCNTIFSRHLEIVDQTETIGTTTVPYIEVRAVVSWSDGGGPTRTITVIDNLYDWQ